MKKLSATFLLFTFLCTGTELHQLLQVPILLHHYLEHRNKDRQIAFADFLKEHYIREHAQAASHHHERLPFKSHHCASPHISLMNPAQPVFTIVKDNPGALRPMTMYKEPYHTNTFTSRIWQPPRPC